MRKSPTRQKGGTERKQQRKRTLNLASWARTCLLLRNIAVSELEKPWSLWPSRVDVCFGACGPGVVLWVVRRVCMCVFLRDINSNRVLCEGSQRILTLRVSAPDHFNQRVDMHDKTDKGL